MSKFIALSEPYFDKDEINIVSRVIKNSWVSTAGKEIGIFEFIFVSLISFKKLFI